MIEIMSVLLKYGGIILLIFTYAFTLYTTSLVGKSLFAALSTKFSIDRACIEAHPIKNIISVCHHLISQLVVMAVLAYFNVTDFVAIIRSHSDFPLFVILMRFNSGSVNIFTRNSSVNYNNFVNTVMCLALGTLIVRYVYDPYAMMFNWMFSLN